MWDSQSEESKSVNILKSPTIMSSVLLPIHSRQYLNVYEVTAHCSGKTIRQ